VSDNRELSEHRKSKKVLAQQPEIKRQSQPVPESLGNVFLRVSEDGWFIRWNESAYVDCRKLGALLGLSLLTELLKYPEWRGSPTQLLGLIYGSHPGSSLQKGMAALGIEGIDEGAKGNAGFGITTLNDENIAKQVLRRVRAAEALIASSLPALATHLKTTLMPPAKWDGVWAHKDPNSHWTCGHLREFVPTQCDESNVLRRESPTEWHVRLGNDECRVPHSDGVEMLCVLLAMPRRFMYAEELLSESGSLQPAVAEQFRIKQLQRTELAELLKEAEEFGPELRDEQDKFYDPPDTTEALADELEQVALRLRAAAKDAYVEERMRSGGHTLPKGATPGSFAELKAKKERCEALITKLRQFDVDRQKSCSDVSAKFGDPVLQARARKAIGAATSAIQARNERIGVYLKSSLRFFEDGFYLDVEEHWRVSNDAARR
jgi:hypothetical protein